MDKFKCAVCGSDRGMGCCPGAGLRVVSPAYEAALDALLCSCLEYDGGVLPVRAAECMVHLRGGGQ